MARKKIAKTQLNLMCPIGGDNLGYISLNILNGFRNNDVYTSLFPIMVDQKLSFNDLNDADICSGAIKYSRNFAYKCPTLKIWHPHDLATKPGNGKYYALIIPDSDYLTAAEIHHINYTNGIFVNSNWAKGILENHKIKSPIYNIYFGVNQEIFSNNIESAPSENYIFYSTGSWSLGNGHDFLIKAFNLAFRPKDNVELRLLPTNLNLTDDETNKWLKLVDNSPIKNKISMFNRLQTQYDMAQFIADADCLLSLQRISITGTAMLEAMAMNKPIIAINCGVVQDYPNSEHFYRVNFDNYEKAYDHRIYYGESNWPSLTKKVLDDTVDIMRLVYKNNIKINIEGLNTINNNPKYTWSNTAKDIMTILYGSKSH
jgi:glycosyltransferase involved in cell wall biosynthesis